MKHRRMDTLVMMNVMDLLLCIMGVQMLSISHRQVNCQLNLSSLALVLLSNILDVNNLSFLAAWKRLYPWHSVSNISQRVRINLEQLCLVMVTLIMWVKLHKLSVMLWDLLVVITELRMSVVSKNGLSVVNLNKIRL